MNKQIEQTYKIALKRKKDKERFSKNHPDAVGELFDLKQPKTQQAAFKLAIKQLEEKILKGDLDFDSFEKKDWTQLEEIKNFLSENVIVALQKQVDKIKKQATLVKTSFTKK